MRSKQRTANPQPITMKPYKIGTGGAVCFPRKSAVENGKPGWKLTKCPFCGAECWETPMARGLIAKDPTLRGACTMCALSGKYGKGVKA